VQKEHKQKLCRKLWNINSMTGMGRSSIFEEQFFVEVIVKSVNNRSLDIKLRLPRELSHQEPAMQALVAEKFSRGRIEAQVDLNYSQLSRSVLVFDQEKAQDIVSQTKSFQDQNKNSLAPLTMGDLLSLPGVIAEDKSKTDLSEIELVVMRAFNDALCDLERGRQREGKALAHCLADLLETAMSSLEWIKASVDSNAADRFSQLKKRCEDLFKEYGSNHERIFQECALLAERSDFKEEIDRLHAHIEHFDAVCRTEGAKGRKLDFICQEMLREINTLLSKVFEHKVSIKGIELKADVDRMREQVQNVA
jgi:uncharacterized protein (TIGR00255 family)